MNAGAEVERAEQPGEVVGLHLRLGRAGEATSDAPQLGRSQMSDALALGGERLGELAGCRARPC